MAEPGHNERIHEPVPVAELLGCLPDAAILLDGRRRVVEANQAAVRLLGGGLIGRDLALSLRHPGALQAVAVVRAGAATRRVELALPVPVKRTLELHVAGLGRATPGAAATLLVLKDVTLAKGAETMRADFVANVSHELRSPLTSLIGFIETLKGPAREDAAARIRFLEIMDSESRRMARLIDDLLSLSRVEVNEHIPPGGEVDLAGLLRHVAARLAARAADKGIAIDLDCPNDLPRISGDQDEITQVFDNLLDNAIKYGRADSRVGVRAAAAARIPDGSEPGVSIAVSNRGEGIAQVHLPRLTERFYRVDKGRSRALGGTGLGLAIVKHMVNHHRGRLDIESQVGEGCTFTVFLPLGQPV